MLSAAGLLKCELHPEGFAKVCEMMREPCGIVLKPGKEGFVKARLIKRLYALNIASSEEYLRFVETDDSGTELICMIDALTTNKTNFFREPSNSIDHCGTQYLARTREVMSPP